MKTYTPIRRISGFTLMELLVVIGIILILMGLVLAIIPAVKLNAQNLAAKNVTKSIEAAVSAYYTEYAKYPPLQAADAPAPDGSKDQWVGDPAMGAQVHNNALFFTLRTIPKGPNENDAANPRRVRYFEYKPAKLSSAGTPRDGFFDRTVDGNIPPDGLNGNLYDPWGREYGVILDKNGDGYIDMQGIYIDFTGADRVSGKAPGKVTGAFSMGKDETLGKKGDRTYRTNSDKSDDTVSWE
jgi:prepilin-type N-terminal cleavage/methylation domain-containing protein